MLQKPLVYKHHSEYYIQSLEEKVIPLGLKINKKPVFGPIWEDFMISWKNILGEEFLVQLLLTKSQIMIKNLDSDIENKLQNSGYENRDKVYLGLKRKYRAFRKALEKCCSKTWQRFRDLYHHQLLPVTSNVTSY